MSKSDKKKIRFIDLFAGLGGIRLGFEQAAKELGYDPECVFTSEIKIPAISSLNKNFKHKKIAGDICQVESKDIPEFDILLAGFPCQAFSSAGKLRGFMDTRGTLFFEVERILKDKKPQGFILENVEGLLVHDKENPFDRMGRTMKTILHSLEDEYEVQWAVLNAEEFGIPQARKRVYIVGSKKKKPLLGGFPVKKVTFGEVMQHKLPVVNSELTVKLLKKYTPKSLYGKALKDKRGGDNNIHSWDIGLKGEVSGVEIELLNKLFKERRKKHWAEVIGIDWMDGMPLTENQISTFFKNSDIKALLDGLVDKKYLVFEHPKKKVRVGGEESEHIAYERIPDPSKPKGYNIVTGKLSYEFSRFLDPCEVAPTLVAMDMSTIGVIDGEGIRHLTLREGLRLFGYPENYTLDMFADTTSNMAKGFDLLGNSVCVPVIKAVALKLFETF